MRLSALLDDVKYCEKRVPKSREDYFIASSMPPLTLCNTHYDTSPPPAFQTARFRVCMQAKIKCNERPCSSFLEWGFCLLGLVGELLLEEVDSSYVHGIHLAFIGSKGGYPVGEVYQIDAAFHSAVAFGV